MYKISYFNFPLFAVKCFGVILMLGRELGSLASSVIFLDVQISQSGENVYLSGAPNQPRIALYLILGNHSLLQCFGSLEFLACTYLVTAIYIRGSPAISYQNSSG